MQSYNRIKRQFSFRFLNCNIGQPSQPVCAKLPSSSCLEPWPHPGKGTLPMPDQAGKLSSERNGGYTRPKGPFHRVAGLAVNCPPLGPPVAQAQPRGRTASMWESSSAVLCVHNTAGLVSSSGWVHCVHCTVCTMCTLYSSVYIVHCTVCTLKTLTAFLAWPKPRQIYSYLFWTRQNVVFNYFSVQAKLSSVLITC